MVEADEKKSQKPPTADELAQAEHYEAMMDAVARDDDEDYDLEDDMLDPDEDHALELAKQRKLLAAVAQQAKKYQGLDFDEMDDSDELMRQMYEEHLMKGTDVGEGDPLAS